MNLTSQLHELFVAYAVTAAAMLAGLLAMRADGRAYFRWPVYSAMTMALGVVLWNLLYKHVVPVQWVLFHSSVLYWSALTVYAVLGLSIGCLLGRLTRNGAGPGNRENSSNRSE